MFFIASKIFWMLAMPLNALCLLALAGFGVRHWRKTCGERMIGLAIIGILFFGLVPVGPFLLTWLEDRYQAPQTLPAKIDGIIVLGGMFDTHLTDARGTITANDNIERMLCFQNLVQKYPSARAVFSGGSGDLDHPDAKEADTALRYMTGKTAPIFYEKDSRNTYENAVFTKELVNPVPGQNWVLVTSAYHMPRSVGIFTALGWPVIPYPCDYRTDGTYHALWQSPNVTANFAMLNIAVKEMIGAVVYYLGGKSAFILPPGSLPSQDD